VLGAAVGDDGAHGVLKWQLLLYERSAGSCVAVGGGLACQTLWVAGLREDMLQALYEGSAAAIGRGRAKLGLGCVSISAM